MQWVTSDVLPSPGQSDVVSVSGRTRGCPVQGTVKQTWGGTGTWGHRMKGLNSSVQSPMTQIYVGTCLRQSPFLEVLRPLSPAPGPPWVPPDQRRGQWAAQPVCSELISEPRPAVWFGRASPGQLEEGSDNLPLCGSHLTCPLLWHTLTTTSVSQPITSPWNLKPGPNPSPLLCLAHKYSSTFYF